MSKLLSVIVPCYNVEKYVKQCLESIKNQTYTNIEIIVINDGSTDKTWDVIKKCASNDERFKIVNRKNEGIGATRNQGILMSKGYYIAFVDSDDYLHPNMYKEMIELIEKEKLDIAVCDYLKFNEVNQKIQKCGDFYNCSIFDKPNLINEVGYAPWNKVYKKSLFNQIEFPVNKKHEDINAVIKVLSLANKISKINKGLYFYRENPNGETFVWSKRDLDICYIMNNLIDFLKQNSQYEKLYNELELMSIMQLQKGLLFGYKSCTTKEIIKYIDEMFELLDNNFKKWRKNKVFEKDKKARKLIKTNKGLYKMFFVCKKIFKF